jgi:predicted nucleotidyltransferase
MDLDRLLPRTTIRRMRDDEYPRWISVPALLGVHWAFQGTLYMDRTERTFKVVTDLVLGAVLWGILRRRLDLAALPVALVLAHTANVLINGQIPCVVKHFGYVQNDYSTFRRQLQRLRSEGRRRESVRAIVVLGSLARDELDETSDLDVRVIRRPGSINGLEASSFVMSERFSALVTGFPLDVFLLDDESSLSKIRDDERSDLVVLYDADGIFDPDDPGRSTRGLE